MPTPTAIRFDEWTLHADVGELERPGKRLRLQELPLQILIELASHPGQLVTREQLVARLWPKGVVEFESSLNTAVSKLRAALGDNAESPRYIETVPRKGYRFIGVLAAPAAEAAPIRTVEVEPESTAPALGQSKINSGSTPDLAAAKSKRVVYWLAAAALVLLLAAAYRAIVSNRPLTHVRLAVLPFENLSPDATNAFFADGMHEEILTTLANRATEMDVISRTTMMTYRARPKSVPEVARELNVTHVLEGSARREGQAVRITVQLIDARNDNHVWSHNYDSRLDSAMTLQSQIAEDVASQLATRLSTNSGDLPPSRNPEAYDLYLRARLATQAITQRTSLDEALRIEAWLSRALELDDAFVAAYVARANIRTAKFVQNLDVGEANQRAALTDVAMAKELAGGAPAVLRMESRTAVFDADSARQRQLLESPVLKASKDPSILVWRAFSMCRQDRCELGLPLYAQAAALDPGNRVIFFGWEMDLWALRQPAEALRVVRSYNEHGPGKISYGDLEFAFTGQTGRLRRDVTELGDSMGEVSRLLSTFDLLRFEGRFSELQGAIDAFGQETIRQGGFREYGTPGIGFKPVADLSGWAALLNKDSAAAARAGKAVLKFAANPPVTRHGEWHVRILAAEGALFSGDREQAIADAHAALASGGVNFRRRFSALLAARVLAWAGAEEQAVTLLEEISSKFPALGPAEITRDPFFSIPLQNNARYKTLEKSLEAEIAANRGLF